MSTNNLYFSQTLKKYKLYYLMLIPGLLFLLIFHYVPLFGVIIAFKDYHPAMGVQGIFTSDWVGFKHFKTFFESYYFKNILFNTLNISIQKLLFGFVAPILFAFMVNEVYGRRSKKLIQTISYLPYFISWVVVASLVSNIFSSEGYINIIRHAIGIESSKNYLTSRSSFVPLVVLSHVWKSMGYGSIIYLASITAIDKEQFEAADIDGATRMQKIWHISLPAIKPVLTIMLIMAIGGIMNAGQEQILLMYSPPVYKVGDIIDTFVFRQGIGSQQYSYSTAVGLFKSIVSAILLLGTNWICKKLGEDGIW